MPPPLIRVLLIINPNTPAIFLKKIFSSSSEIQVVGTAISRKEALKLIPQVRPDLICLDLHMPKREGVEVTDAVMAHYPRPILIISFSDVQQSMHNVGPLLEAGAIDVFSVPLGEVELSEEQLTRELVSKIKILSGVIVFRRQERRMQAAPHPPAANTQYAETPSGRIVVMGASTGGPQALRSIFMRLPNDFAIPILCVQHISNGFLQGFIDWLASHCKMQMKIAQPGEVPLPGVIYFPQENTHLETDAAGRLNFSFKEPFKGHCPSITVTMRSVVSYYGRGTVGVLLTGMGGDGAEGMQMIAQAGGITIAQDEKSCVVFGMPKQAIELGAAQHVLSVDKIAHLLIDLPNGKS